MIRNEQAYKNNPIISIKQDGKYGFKNKKGKIVVPAIYDRVTELNQFGYAGIKKMENGVLLTKMERSFWNHFMNYNPIDQNF